jgi:hypothetical protein
MSPRTTITRKDLVLGTFAVSWRSREFWISWGFWVVFIGVFIVLTREMPRSTANWLALSIGATVGATASQIVVLIFGLWRSVRRATEADGVLGEHLFELRENGIFEKTIANETLSAWSSVRSLRRVPGYVLVEVPRGAFHFIPERCFADASEYEQFWQELNAHV